MGGQQMQMVEQNEQQFDATQQQQQIMNMQMMQGQGIDQAIVG